MAEAEADLDRMAEATASALRVRPSDDGFEGVAPGWFGPHLFGGFVVGQAVYAAGLTVPAGRRIHSLHAYFLLPARADRRLSHRVISIRDGRTLAHRQVRIDQEGQTIFTMSCSYTAVGGDPVHERRLDPAVPDASALPAERSRGPWEVARTGERGRAWIRMPPLGEDQLLNDAMLGFFSDLTGAGGMPIPIPGVEDWVSLDHAVWFHGPLRADDWLFYDVETLVASPKRGLIRGLMYGPDRRLGLSMAQEALLRGVG